MYTCANNSQGFAGHALTAENLQALNFQSSDPTESFGHHNQASRTHQAILSADHLPTCSYFTPAAPLLDQPFNVGCCADGAFGLEGVCQPSFLHKWKKV